MVVGWKVTQVWSDEHLVSLECEVGNGAFYGKTSLYVTHDDVPNIAKAVSEFSMDVSSSPLVIELGQFGPAFVAGALRAELRYSRLKRLFVDVLLEADFEESGEEKTADTVSLRFETLLGNVDRFVGELRALRDGESAMLAVRS